MEDSARENLLDHFENPRQNGSIDGAEITCERTTPLCGDRVHVDIKLAADGATIMDAKFEGDGCIISQAAASMLIESIVGKTIDAVEAIEPQAVLDMVRIPLSAQRVKCALLGLQTAKDGIREWREARTA
jgi:nitrogen fixation NifU-like protein